MRHHEDESSSDIEREVAAQRAEVSATLEEIKGRLSPGEFLDQMLRDARTRDAVSRIGSAIGRNPLPVVLIGVGALWLALASNRPERSPAYRRPARAGRRGPPCQWTGKS